MRKIYKMKKAIVFGLSAILVTLPINAVMASESVKYTDEEKALYEMVKKGVEVDGEVIVLPNEYLTQLESYLLTTDLTNEQVLGLESAVEEVKTQIIDAGVNSYKELVDNAEIKQNIYDKFEKVNEEQELNLSLSLNDNVLEIKGEDNKPIFVGDSSKPVEPTSKEEETPTSKEEESTTVIDASNNNGSNSNNNSSNGSNSDSNASSVAVTSHTGNNNYGVVGAMVMVLGMLGASFIVIDKKGMKDAFEK